MPTKRLYRVTSDHGSYVSVKHFQSKRAAMNYAAHQLSGKTRYDEYYNGDSSRPPALTAIIHESDPITFSEK